MRIPDTATKKEYRAYAQNLRRTMNAELKKPEAERDDELIEECETSILYCEERLSALGAGKKKHDPLSIKPLRWAAAAAVVVLILGTGIVSYSYGRKALSDEVQWNVRRYWFDGNYIKTYEEQGEMIPRNEFETRSFDSEDELRAAYGEELLLPGSLTGVYFVSATAYGEPGNALIRVEYRVNKKPLILEIDSYVHDDDDASFYSTLGFNFPDDFKTVHWGRAYIGWNQDVCFVSFGTWNEDYILTGSQGVDIVVDIAEKMMEIGGMH